METTAGVTLAAMSETEPGSRVTPGSTWDSCVPGASSGVSPVGPGEVPAEAAADRADEQDGEQREHGEPDREVAQAQLLAALRVDDDRAVLLRPRRRRRGRRARRARTGRATGRCGRRASTTARRRCGGGPAGRRAGPAGRAARSPAGRRRAAAPRRAAAGPGARRGGRLSAKLPSTASGRPNAASWPGRRAGTGDRPGRQPVRRVAERPPSAAAGARTRRRPSAAACVARRRRRPGGRPTCSGGSALAA